MPRTRGSGAQSSLLAARALRPLVLAAVACVPSCASAQTRAPDAFVGRWTARFTLRGELAAVDVTIDRSGGTWGKHPWANIKFDTCANRPMPIRIESASDRDLSFRVDRAATIAGCFDTTVTLHAVDHDTLVGRARWGAQSRDFALRLDRD